MAQTKEQWYDKIATFLPGWMLDKPAQGVFANTLTPELEALFFGLAEVAAVMEAEVYAQFAKTYLDNATAELLDLHGNERLVDRLTGETDAAYRPRIKAFGATFNETSLENALDSILDSDYVEYNLAELEGDGPWFGTTDMFFNQQWASSLQKLYNYGLVELLPKKVVIDTNTTILVTEELQAPWLVVAEGVTLTVQGTLSASFVRGPGTVVNSGGTIQTYAAYDSYVSANKATIYSQLEEFLTNNKALGVFVAIQSYMESGI